MNQTPPKLIYTIVIAVAVLAFMGVGSLCAAVFTHTWAEPSVLGTLISITGTLVGSLVTMLSSTRTQAATGTTTQTTTTTTAPPPPAEPMPVTIENPISDPANVTNVKNK